MTDTLARNFSEDVDLTAPLAIVSSDSHVGPLLSDLRAYCPLNRRRAFDAFVEGHAAAREARLAQMGGFAPSPEGDRLAAHQARMLKTTGHHDIHARLRDMDDDGIAAEVIYHGTNNGQPIPFVGALGLMNHTGEGLDLAAVGMRIYNRWLGDACSVAPDRLVGCAHLPFWDVQATIKELRSAREVGVTSVNFPAPRPGIPLYDHPVWEPFWSACEDLDMTLSTHAGAVDAEANLAYGPHVAFVVEVEAGGWPARRALHRLVFGGVFERHPRLKLVLAEQNHHWWTATAHEYDSMYVTHAYMVRDQVPRLPSDYLREHVFIGASFMAPFEAEAAVREGYVDNVIWGRDYPHVEGTWQHREDPSEENMTHLSLRYAYAAIPSSPVKAMLSDNGARVYGLDPKRLANVARRIGAPTLADLARPIDAIPEPGRGGALSFRTIGPWG